MTCLDFQTGDTLWRDRKGPKGSLLLADGRLYLRGEEGEIFLLNHHEKSSLSVAVSSNPIAAVPKRGPIQSLPTESSTYAIRDCCSATT